MRNRVALGASLTAALLVCSALPAAERCKSGPQVGSTKLTPFNPLNVTGAQAGEKACQI
jgi:hypothetical protein